MAKKAPKKTSKTENFSLKLLGNKINKPSKILETFPNVDKGRPYLVELATEEFTCLCPITGQPDFAKITIRYIPAEKIVESKSLKFYLWSFRNEGGFHEHMVNVILNDLVEAMQPVWCEVEGVFNARGGIAIKVNAQYGKKEE
ncbi:MAG: NADPH-dependent 7-cyano-7-deazaguanine reductase QueF [Opitutales bacterium]|nr:NADPH-dependent 7-cyano-7-deazaguanine reductase QueF [Opitutales bacterium]